MSWFTPADGQYLKTGMRRVSALRGMAVVMEALGDAKRASEAEAEYDAELARLEAFIDGCTLEKGKGSA